MTAEAHPDDGIPVLTDIIDGHVPVPPPITRPGPAQRGGPVSLNANSGFGPNSMQGATPLTRSGPPSGMPAPPISGPPSLSEFGGSSDKTSIPPHPNSAEAFAARVEAAVLERLLPRIEPVVEARLRENLADVLEKVLAQMTQELKYSAGLIIRDTITEAVNEEIDAQRARDRAQR